MCFIASGVVFYFIASHGHRSSPNVHFPHNYMEFRDVEDVLQHGAIPPPFRLHFDSNAADTRALDGAVIAQDDLHQG